MTTEADVILPVLRILNGVETGSLPTGEVRRRVRETLCLSSEDLLPLRNRPDQRIDQTIRNLKSHRLVAGNPFSEGLLRDIPRGFEITEQGRRLLRGR